MHEFSRYVLGPVVLSGESVGEKMVNMWEVPWMKMDIPVRLTNLQMELKGRIVTFKIRTHLLVDNSNLLRYLHSQRILSPSIFP